jgi:hypothetical protein
VHHKLLADKVEAVRLHLKRALYDPREKVIIDKRHLERGLPHVLCVGHHERDIKVVRLDALAFKIMALNHAQVLHRPIPYRELQAGINRALVYSGGGGA